MGELEGRVALVTGGAGAIGACVAQRLRASGADVVIADADARRGADVAMSIDALFVRCDVASPQDSVAAVAAAVARFGGLDIALLNAGVSEHGPIDEPFDVARYRAMAGVNFDGVVYGVAAAIPAMRRRGGGDIVATASLAGLTPMPADPIYTATKHAVVGLVRALGPAYLDSGIRVNAVCPGFTDTPMLAPIRETLVAGGMPLLTAPDVADAFFSVLASGDSGQCWYVQPGRRSEPFSFRGIPGPRRETSG